MAIIRFLILISIFASSLSLWAQSISVSAEVDQSAPIYENMPITGIITVTHPENAQIDPDSFRMENSPMRITFIKNTQIGTVSPLFVSIYQFQMQGKPKGIYELPTITVKVGGQTYQTIPSTYLVQSVNPAYTPPPSNPAVSYPPAPSAPATAPAAQPLQPASITQGHPELGLKAYVEGNKTLYPGQRATLVYLYSFVGDISLKEEVLPMLTPTGLKKLGDTMIKDFQKDGIGYHLVTLQIEAENPGTFSFGPSHIAGYPIYQDIYGNKVYGPLIKAEAPIVTIVVKPFPTVDIPASFNGAVGSYTFNVRLASRPEITIGDKMRLSVEISGEGNLEKLPLPELVCQPGWSGLFKFGSLPPAGEINGNAKNFPVDITPLSTAIKEIPAIEFSFYNPAQNKYIVLRSKPIPIKVKALQEKQVETIASIPPPRLPEQNEAPPIPLEKLKIPPPIEINGNISLTPRDLNDYLFGVWWVLLIIPIGAGLLYMQINMRRFMIEEAAKIKQKSSQEWFKEAMEEQTESPVFYHALYQAFFTKLKEIGELENDNISPEDLPLSGIAGEVRSFLLSLEETRFARKAAISKMEILKQAKALFQKLNHKDFHGK